MGPSGQPAAPTEAMAVEAGTASEVGLVARLRRRGREVGLSAVGIAPATPMEEARRALEHRKAVGLDGGMQFTYRNPARSTDPGRVLPGAAAVVVGAWWYGGTGADPADGGHPPGDGRPRGRVARYAWRDHYADLRTPSASWPLYCREDGWAARVVADDNALADRAAATRAGLGWYGKNSNVLLPGGGSWFVLGAVVPDAPLPADLPYPTVLPAGGACGLPDRCPGGAGGVGRPALPGLAPAGPRGVPLRAPGGAG